LFGFVCEEEIESCVREGDRSEVARDEERLTGKAFV
jgi:hypothetical protein